MHIRPKHCFTAVALFALAIPVWARTDTAQLTVIQPTTIGTTQLKPGDYKLEVTPNATQLKVVNTDSGQTIAQVPCHWFQLQKKPDTTEVVTNNNQVIEVDFGGKTQAIKVGS
jgi:hypothetical protein